MQEERRMVYIYEGEGKGKEFALLLMRGDISRSCVGFGIGFVRTARDVNAECVARAVAAL